MAVLSLWQSYTRTNLFQVVPTTQNIISDYFEQKNSRDKIDQTLEYDRRRGHDNLHVQTRPSNDAWQTARANLDPYFDPYFTFFKAFLTSEKFYFYFTVERGPKSTYCKKPLVSSFSGSLHLGGRSAVGRTEPRIQIIN